MVDELLVQRARELLGEIPLRILITGGTGFVGSHLARALDAAGHDVTITGRNRYQMPQWCRRLRFERADIRDPRRVNEICQGQEMVFHAAARTTPWGSLDQLRAINVDGTRHVVDGCLAHGVRRLVHISSTAIFFEFRDKLLLPDDAPLPERFSCPYAASKAEAEQVVSEAARLGLDTFTVRARAVFGPGDRSLLPRLLSAARRGRLRQIGHGQNRIDMTYVDNLVVALVLAAIRGQPGQVCTITNDEPIEIWQLIREVLANLGVDAQLRPVPYAVAKFAAGAMELYHWLRPRLGEPPLTRYGVGLLAKCQTFDLAAARQQLDYQPIVSMAEGIRRTVATLKARDDRHAPVQVKLQLSTTGYTAQPKSYAEFGAAPVTVRFHAAFAVIQHPHEGITLLDTGYAPRFFEATARWPYQIYAKVTPVVTRPELTAAATLQRMGVDADAVRRVIITHFHADHVCGLRDFPRADFIASGRAWRAVSGLRGWSAMQRCFLPALLPEDFVERLHCIDHFHDPGFGPLDHSHDLFGDGSVRLFELSGHATGQMGAMLQIAAERRALMVADAVWTSATLRENLRLTRFARFLADSADEAIETKARLHQLHQAYEDLEMIPTHCPEVAQRYEFDRQIDSAASRAPQVTMTT